LTEIVKAVKQSSMTDSNNPERAQRILDAAADLIAHYGYDKTTVDDIARKAGVSKGAIYLHYKGKEDLFEALLLRESERLSEQLFMQWETQSTRINLFTIYTDALTLVAQNPMLKALYGQDRRVLGDYLRKLAKTTVFNNAFSFGVDFVKQFQAAGLLRDDIKPETLAYILLLIRYGLFTVDEFVPMQPPSMEELAPVLGDMLQRGLAPADVENNEAARAALNKLLSYGMEIIRQRRAQRDEQ
jgi:AcrR family transcriptional regulator